MLIKLSEVQRYEINVRIEIVNLKAKTTHFILIIFNYNKFKLIYRKISNLFIHYI